MMLCGLVGNKVKNSFSPRVHALLAPGAYTYKIFELGPEDFRAFMDSRGFDGLNVTMPYKKEAAAICSELSPLAAALGSVNTVVKRADGSLYGDNTDYFGFEYMLKRSGADLRGKKALVLGSGGAGVTVSEVLRNHGADVTVISRGGPDNYGNLERHKNASLIVNTTPVGGIYDEGSLPLDLRRFEALEAVLDIVYNPLRTALAMQAESLGIPFTGGLGMLVAQAARSSELFTGKTISSEAVEAAAGTLEKELRNIVLIGMPGCGKTTIARELGRLTGRRVYDTDEMIEERAGMSIPAYFEKYGESAFRRLETELLTEACRNSGAVIATGGGSVTVPANYPAMHGNGVIIRLERELSLLPSSGRPLSEGIGIEELARRREPLYAMFSDMSADNNSSPQACALSILEALK